MYQNISRLPSTATIRTWQRCTDKDGRALGLIKGVAKCSPFLTCEWKILGYSRCCHNYGEYFNASIQHSVSMRLSDIFCDKDSMGL